MLLCVFVYALFHVANYAHGGDTAFGKSTAARIFIISGEILCLISVVFIPVDVAMKTRGETALEVSRWFWIVLVFVQMTYIWVISPILFAFYESDEKDKPCKRLYTAVRL